MAQINASRTSPTDREAIVASWRKIERAKRPPFSSFKMAEQPKWALVAFLKFDAK